jgi:glycogen(starch) synthase
MNVLQVPNAYAPIVGGVEKAVAEIARELASRKHGVEVVTARNPPWLRGYERIGGIPLHRVPFYVYRDSVKSALAMVIGLPIACQRLFRLVSARRPCVVHTQFVYHNAVGVELLRPRLQKMGVPVVLTFHGGDSPNIPSGYRLSHRSESRILDWAATRLLRHADGLTAVSAHLRGLVLSSGREIGTDIRVIHNGVNERLFAPGSETEERPVILSIGRLAHEKGFDLLIEAFAGVGQHLSEWELHIAGDGLLHSRLQKQIDTLRLTGKVRLLGMLSEERVVSAIRSATIIAAASRWEGCSLAALEALSCAKAFVSTDTTGVREVVSDGVNGIVVPVEDPRSLGQALVRLVKDSTLRRALASRARSTVLSQFTWSKVVDQYEALYRELLSRRPPAMSRVRAA